MKNGPPHGTVAKSPTIHHIYHKWAMKKNLLLSIILVVE